MCTARDDGVKRCSGIELGLNDCVRFSACFPRTLSDGEGVQLVSKLVGRRVLAVSSEAYGQRTSSHCQGHAEGFGTSILGACIHIFIHSYSHVSSFISIYLYT